jgi:outer membrane protein OmpA-like peptidoglycan-associated protein
VEDEDLLSFNFWPAFADMMLALVLILTLVLTSFAALVGGFDQAPIRRQMMGLAHDLERGFEGRLENVSGNDDSLVIQLGGGLEGRVTIYNRVTDQVLTFSDRILFPKNIADLNPQGMKVLSVVGRAIKNRHKAVKELQIQGHADPDPTSRFSSNLELAALRAMSVFSFLQDSLGIDPTHYLMSATSFGEYKPVGRTGDEPGYDAGVLRKANADSVQKAMNRRIEILLFYRLNGTR